MVERSSSLGSRIKDSLHHNLNLIYFRKYISPPPRSELALSQLSNDGPMASSPIAIPHTALGAITEESTPPTEPEQEEQRKLRLVCISDTHNASPLDGVFKIPAGDVLIHCGDFTNQGSLPEITKFVTWLKSLPHELKLVVPGNHDGVTLDPVFHADYAAYFKTPAPQSHKENLALLTNQSARDAGIVYLNHQAARIDLKDGRYFRVFGSPWVPKCGLWGFGYDPPESLADSVWKDVPANGSTTVLITHGPPKYHLDGAPSKIPIEHRGCEMLRQALARTRPLVHVFGHVHEAGGAAEKVKWDLSGFGGAREGAITVLEDPAPEGKKTFVVDARRVKSGVETVLVNAAVKRGGRKEGWGKAVVVEIRVPVGVALGGRVTVGPPDGAADES